MSNFCSASSGLAADAVEAAVEEDGGDAEAEQEAEPYAFGADAEHESEEVGGRDGDAVIGHGSVEHRPLGVLKSTERSH